MNNWAPPILCLDCSGADSGVALVLQTSSGLQTVALSRTEGLAQASDLALLGTELLAQQGLTLQDLRGLAVCQGPGSFTGLRIGLGLAQGLALGLGLRTALVSTFELVAWRDRPVAEAWSQTPLRLPVALDARLGEVFQAEVALDGARGRLQRVSDSQILPMGVTTAVAEPSGGPSRAEALADLLAWELQRAGPDGLEDRLVSPEGVQPLYGRDRVASTIEERRQNASLQLMPLQVTDLASVMVIENQAYPFPWTSGNFRDSLAAGYTARKLVDQGAMVGYFVWMQTLDEAHLLNFTIAPTRQTRGLGTWMLRRLLEALQTAGIVRILLEVRPSNTSALRLYLRHGFEQIGRRQGYYPAADNGREDALVLAKPLGGTPS